MKNKKVATITWHTYNNYGGVLQAYALRQAIIQLGYNKVDIIDYNPNIQRKKITKKDIYRKLLLRQEYIKKLIKEKNEKFDKFRKDNFTFTRKCDNATELFLLNDQYDKFICGSDQIWAPTLYNENYFLSFVNNDSKKISYAPSMGLTTIENRYVKENIRKLVSKFESISIREEKGKEIIKEFTNKDIEVVLDPTLLLNKEEWNKNFELEDSKKDYIVFYCLGSNKKHYKTAKKIAKSLNMELKIIPGDVFDYKKEGLQNASPEEFLKLIYNASMVITDSFHGTIFSINFNIPFVTLKRFKDNKFSQNSRIYNILKKVNLEERIYNDNLKYFVENTKVDFAACNKIIEQERKNSLKFLQSSLEKENKDDAFNIITNICAGCGMCAEVCPKKCITIKLNDKGFYCYEIDEKKCIKCNKCKKVCGQLSTDAKELEKMKLYSAYSLNENVLKTSSSGGIAYEISLYGIQNKMPVIGCTYNLEKNRAEHIKVTKEKDLLKLSGSKYLQSYMPEALKELEKMEKGIVIGTPCQIASIDRYLKNINKRERFILVDLICHGVPSYHLWKKYISKYNKIEDVKFRDKKYGWRSMTMSINSEYHKSEEKDLFYDLFRTQVAYNKACYECKYRIKTNADIRIGDYWGPKFKKEKSGISMVIVNTENGKELIEKLIENKKIKVKSQLMDDYFKVQQIVNETIPILYDQIISELKDEKSNLTKISKKYCKGELRYNKIKKLVFKMYAKIKDN